MTVPSADAEGWTPLHGGNVNTVARKGGVVRRKTGPGSPAVHQVLRWLEAGGLQGVPRLLEVDGEEEFLTFLPGTPVFRPWPGEVKEARWLAGLGDWLRRYHHAIRGFTLEGDAAFAWGPSQPTSEMIVCHGDLGPWNCLHQTGKLTGVIDWDLARYGSPLDDVAELALEAVPLHPRTEETLGTHADPSVLRERLRVFCDAYGSATPEEVLMHLPTYLKMVADDTRALAERGTEPFTSFVEGGIADALDADREHVLSTWLNRGYS